MEQAGTTAPDEREGDDTRELKSSGGFGSLGSIVFLLTLAWAAFLAVRPLNDNSFFTHLATGRLILDDRSVPSADPYTYTAVGEPWTVQSWLASATYATAERAGGVIGLRLLVAVLFVCAALLLWKLSAPARSIVPRLLIIAAAMTVASAVWSERPYMVACIGVALIWLALDGRVPPWALVPYMWVWVNSHGSYPVAVALCAVVLIGACADARRLSLNAAPQELRVLAAVVGGVVLGGASPLGVRAWTFPLQALSRSETFGLVAEWQSPAFTSTSERAFLVLVLAGLASVVVRARWRNALPLMLFVAAALLARRNIVMALPVLVAVISSSAPAVGTLRSASRPILGHLLAVPLVLLVAVVFAAGIAGPDVTLDGYPIRALALVDQQQTSGRLVTQDFTGNLIEVFDGASGAVFVDDRVDMFPATVLDDYVALNRAEKHWTDVLDRYDADAVVWESSHPFATVLVASPRWRIGFADAAWVVAYRRTPQ